MRSRVRSNPAWTNSALERHWEALERKVGAARMPIVERGSKGLTAREYGSGYYGTVLPTHTKGTVLKITSDPTEAKFAYAAKRLRHYPAGIVKYGPVFELGGSHDGRPIFALWREEAYDVGDAVSGRSEDSLNDIIDYADKAFKLLGTRDQRTQNLQAIRDAAKKFRGQTGYENCGHPSDFEQPIMFRRSTRAGYGVDAAQELAQCLAGSKDIPLVGKAIVELADQGVLLSDVHGGNVGKVKRGSRSVAVITDPGNVVFLNERLAELEPPSIDRSQRDR